MTTRLAWAFPLCAALLLCTVAARVNIGEQAENTLPWLSVKKVEDRYIIVDESDREVILRGANVELERRELNNPRPYDPKEYDGKCPPNYRYYEEGPFCEVDYGNENADVDPQKMNDMAQIRHLGFNVIRLCLTWSELEEQPGVYNKMYLDRVEQVVNWATEQRVYVFLDLHEDLYSRFIVSHDKPIGKVLTPGDGQDGAPEWAVMTNGWPALSFMGIGNLNFAMMKAFSNFWENAKVDVPQGEAPGLGLQDHYIGAVAALAKRFYNCSTVIGIEIMNEPQPGTHVEPYHFASKYLYPFYRRVIQAVTGVRDGMPTCPLDNPNQDVCAYPDLGVRDTRHAMIFEPNSFRNILDFTPQTSRPFSEFKNLIYAPHTYTHIFTIDQQVFHWPANNSYYPPNFDMAYITGRYEANQMRSALLITEFGCGEDQDSYHLTNFLNAQEKARVGSAFWSWKANGNGQWSMFRPAALIQGDLIEPSGPIRSPRNLMLMRIAPRAVAGSLLGYRFNHVTMSGVVVAESNAPVTVGDEEHETVIHVPHSVSSTNIKVTGGAVLDKIVTDPRDQNRLIYVAPTGTGVYQIQIGDDSACAELALEIMRDQHSHIKLLSSLSSESTSESVQQKAQELCTALKMFIDAVEQGIEVVTDSTSLVEKLVHLGKGSIDMIRVKNLLIKVFMDHPSAEDILSIIQSISRTCPNQLTVSSQ